MYQRQHTPSTLPQLDAYERLSFETGFVRELLQRAWDDKCNGRGAQDFGPERVKPESRAPQSIDPDVAIRIRKLRAKAGDPAVGPVEAASFAAKADELLRKYLR